MKNFFWLFFILFLSCDNELYINNDWEDIPVIYSILNPGVRFDADGNVKVPTESIYDGIDNIKCCDDQGRYYIDFNYDDDANEENFY